MTKTFEICFEDLTKEAQRRFASIVGDEVNEFMPIAIIELGEENTDVPPTMETEDKVNHPNHYTFGSIEVIDYIRDKMTPDEFQGYCMGNILKYISRHKHKNGVEDLKKAQVYLGWLIESEEGAK